MYDSNDYSNPPAPGLLNGPLFRYFTYRQVAAFSALLCAIGVLCTSAANSFGTYALTFSVLYGAGCGLNQSANSLALNTYFRERRRIATGISWTATALGPILFPQVIAVLLPLYGVQVGGEHGRNDGPCPGNQYTLTMFYV